MPSSRLLVLPWLLLSGWVAPGCSAPETEEAVVLPFSGPAGAAMPPAPSSASNASAGAAATPATSPAPLPADSRGNEAPNLPENLVASGGAGGAASAAPAPAAAGSAGSPSSAPAVPVPEPVPGGRFGLGGASRCGSGEFAVCESFEAAALGASAPAGWSFAGYGNRSLRVVDDDSARGERALRVDVEANQGAVVGMLSRGNPAALGQSHFGRSFLKIQAPAPTGFVHFDAFEARGDFNGQANLVRWASTGTNVGTASSNWSWIYNVQSTDHGEFGSEGPRSAHPREGDWMCLEWSMDAGAQEARFWFDALEVDYLHIDTERAELPVFDTFNIGFQKFQQSGAWSVWVDEVAFDEQRIGCDG